MNNTAQPEQNNALAIEHVFQQAVSFHQAGDLQDAACLYNEILQTHPDHLDANYNLGILSVQMKQPAAALPYFITTINADPTRGQNWVSYIDALFQADQLETANEVMKMAKLQGLEGDDVEALTLRIKAGAQTLQSNNTPYPQPVQETLSTAKTAPSKNRNPKPKEINKVVTLFGQGRYSEAAPLAKTLTQNHPLHEFGWKALGAALMQLGLNLEALAPMKKATSLSPKDVEAHYNYGSILQSLGRLTEAEASYRNALIINPIYAHAHCNLGSVLQVMGRLIEAETCYRMALKINPEYAKAHSNLGAVFQDMGKLDEAENSYRHAIQIQPENSELHYNLSITLKESGRLTEAETVCRKSIRLNPEYAEAYFHLGNVLHDLVRLDEAESSYRQAIQIKPNYIDALNNLALLLNIQSKTMAALETAKHSLQIKETSPGKNIFVACIKRMRFTQDNHEYRLLLARAITEAWDRPSELALMGSHFIQLNSVINTCVTRANESWPEQLSALDLFGAHGLATLSSDPLLNALLESTPLCDIKLERFLTLARHALLETARHETIAISKGLPPLVFFSALSRQCFINEYVYFHSDGEFQTARKLRDELVTAIANSAPIPALSLIAVAAYFPLGSLPHADKLLERQWPEAINTLLKQQVTEPEAELKLRDTVPRITPIEDKVSLLVQDQYEHNPYPRWVKTNLVEKAKNIVGYLCQKFPQATFNRDTKDNNIDILIAGCGTGQHSIATAQRNLVAQVLAVDLSLSSLAYAKRKSQELGLTTITYAQADLLKLAQLERSFDVIESVGVLHHLANPWAGWQVLVSLLRPNGFMKLGFYSELARRNIARIRDHIATQCYGSTNEDIRQARQDLIALNDDSDFGETFSSPDFFSISTCRDLLFHVQEHRMVLSELHSFLKENNLCFMGFEIEAPILYAYKLRFPNDFPGTNLEQWSIFEHENPDTFFSMYQFWIQKRA
jgi:tetratricopeptide (TPR) repeat protein/SAM-dependent methyltransferase